MRTGPVFFKILRSNMYGETKCPLAETNGVSSGIFSIDRGQAVEQPGAANEFGLFLRPDPIDEGAAAKRAELMKSFSEQHSPEAKRYVMMRVIRGYVLLAGHFGCGMNATKLKTEGGVVALD